MKRIIGSIAVALILTVAAIAGAEVLTLDLPTACGGSYSVAGSGSAFSVRCAGGGIIVTPPQPVCGFGQKVSASGTACEAITCPAGAKLNSAGSGCEAAAEGFSGDCAGFPHTAYIQMNWSSPARMYTASYGGFGLSDAVVVEFVSGSVSSTTSLPRITAAEYQSSPSSRIATLSPKPCDFGQQSAPGANMQSNSITGVFALGTGTGFGYYPVIPLNTKYYLNIKNSSNSTCAQNNACDIFVDLLKPGGL